MNNELGTVGSLLEATSLAKSCLYQAEAPVQRNQFRIPPIHVMAHGLGWYKDKLGTKTTLRKFSMSEALPVIFFLHFGQSSGFKPNLV